MEARGTDVKENETQAAAFWGRKEISLKDIALAMATTFTIVALSNVIASAMSGIIPTDNAVLQILNTLFGNMYLWITTLSMLCATLKPGFFGEIQGSQELT